MCWLSGPCKTGVETASSAEDVRAGKKMLKTGNMMGIGAIVNSICFTEGRSSDFESEAVEIMNETLCLEKQDLD